MHWAKVLKSLLDTKIVYIFVSSKGIKNDHIQSRDIMLSTNFQPTKKVAPYKLLSPKT